MSQARNVLGEPLAECRSKPMKVAPGDPTARRCFR